MLISPFPLLTDLDQLHSSFHSMSFPDLPPAPKIPQGSQFGSHGTPLPPSTSGLFTNYSQKVEIDLSQFQLGVPCSLEKLGIVPTRSLGKKKFGSLMSLQFSFKSHYPPPSNISYPVVIRAVIPGYPAASTSLKSGKILIVNFTEGMYWLVLLVPSPLPMQVTPSYLSTNIQSIWTT